MDSEVQQMFSSEELTRIYRETAAAVEPSGDRLTVLLAPYGLPAAGATPTGPTVRPPRRDDGSLWG